MRVFVPAFWRREHMPEREVWRLTPQAVLWYIDDWESQPPPV